MGVRGLFGAIDIATGAHSATDSLRLLCDGLSLRRSPDWPLQAGVPRRYCPGLQPHGPCHIALVLPTLDFHLERGCSSHERLTRLPRVDLALDILPPIL